MVTIQYNRGGAEVSEGKKFEERSHVGRCRRIDRRAAAAMQICRLLGSARLSPIDRPRPIFTATVDR